MRWTERQRAMLREMGVVLPPIPHMKVEAAVAAAGPEASTRSSPTTRATRSAESSASVESAKSIELVKSTASAMSIGLTDAPTTASDAASDAVAWLIVGEPFDAVDAGAGAGAMDGDAERLLDNMLRAIGVARDGAGAKVSPQATARPGRRARFVALTGRGAEVERGAGAAAGVGAGRGDGADRLAWQAAVSASTRCILVLGRAAAETVLGIDQPIGSLRGRVHAWQGTPVVVTFAPAYLLRHPADKARAWADLCLAVQAAERERPIESAPASASA